jgi:MFS family permease
LAATFVGIGLGRFAYTPIVPFLIAAHWVDASGAAYAGAANLAGYFAGAALAHRLGRAFGSGFVIRTALVLTTLAFLACAFPEGFWWLADWRLIAGVAGAVLMILGPSRVLSAVPGAARGRAAGVILTGVGLGAFLGGAVVAPLAAHGVGMVWFGLAGLAALAALLSWRAWGAPAPAFTRPTIEPGPAMPARGLGIAVVLLLLGYACDGAGFVPHTIFWVDYVSRALDLGTTLGAVSWLMFGIGATVGPIVLGAFADQLGLGRTLVLAFLIKAAAVLLPTVTTALPALMLSPLLVGALSPGLASLMSARLAEVYESHGHSRIWGFATLGFAVAQAIGGYAMSATFDLLRSYTPLFLAGGALELVGALLAGAAWFCFRKTRLTPAAPEAAASVRSR